MGVYERAILTITSDHRVGAALNRELFVRGGAVDAAETVAVAFKS